MITLEQEDVHFVESRSWYQTINFGNKLVSKGCDWCGDPAWKNIKKLLPERLDGARILDLGCNAGIFCVRAALMGAREVVGVDWPGWRPEWDFSEQRQFVKGYFERQHGKLPITYYTERMEDFLKRPDLGKFDYTLGIASLYYTEDPISVVRRIADISDNVILRLRDDPIIQRFTSLFKHCGFEEKRELREKWWEVLQRQTDDFYLYLYGKDPLLEIIYYRLAKGHRELVGSDALLDVWELMELVGTEKKLEKYVSRVPEEFLTYVPLGKFIRFMTAQGVPRPFKPSNEELAKYPWGALAESIKTKGFIIPVIVEQEGDMYRSIEGRHRVAAASMLEPFNPDMLIPCVLVKEEGRRV